MYIKMMNTTGEIRNLCLNILNSVKKKCDEDIESNDDKKNLCENTSDIVEKMKSNYEYKHDNDIDGNNKDDNNKDDYNINVNNIDDNNINVNNIDDNNISVNNMDDNNINNNNIYDNNIDDNNIDDNNIYDNPMETKNDKKKYYKSKKNDQQYKDINKLNKQSSLHNKKEEKDNSTCAIINNKGKAISKGNGKYPNELIKKEYNKKKNEKNKKNMDENKKQKYENKKKSGENKKKNEDNKKSHTENKKDVKYNYYSRTNYFVPNEMNGKIFKNNYVHLENKNEFGNYIPTYISNDNKNMNRTNRNENNLHFLNAGDEKKSSYVYNYEEKLNISCRFFIQESNPYELDIRMLKENCLTVFELLYREKKKWCSLYISTMNGPMSNFNYHLFKILCSNDEIYMYFFLFKKFIFSCYIYFNLVSIQIYSNFSNIEESETSYGFKNPINTNVKGTNNKIDYISEDIHHHNNMSSNSHSVSKKKKKDMSYDINKQGENKIDDDILIKKKNKYISPTFFSNSTNISSACINSYNMNNLNEEISYMSNTFTTNNHNNLCDTTTCDRRNNIYLKNMNNFSSIKDEDEKLLNFIYDPSKHLCGNKINYCSSYFHFFDKNQEDIKKKLQLFISTHSPTMVNITQKWNNFYENKNKIYSFVEKYKDIKVSSIDHFRKDTTEKFISTFIETFSYVNRVSWKDQNGVVEHNNCNYNDKEKKQKGTLKHHSNNNNKDKDNNKDDRDNNNNNKDDRDNNNNNKDDRDNNNNNKDDNNNDNNKEEKKKKKKNQSNYYQQHNICDDHKSVYDYVKKKDEEQNSNAQHDEKKEEKSDTVLENHDKQENIVKRTDEVINEENDDYDKNKKTNFWNIFELIKNDTYNDNNNDNNNNNNNNDNNYVESKENSSISKILDEKNNLSNKDQIDKSVEKDIFTDQYKTNKNGSIIQESDNDNYNTTRNEEIHEDEDEEDEDEKDEDEKEEDEKEDDEKEDDEKEDDEKEDDEKEDDEEQKERQKEHQIVETSEKKRKIILNNKTHNGDISHNDNNTLYNVGIGMFNNNCSDNSNTKDSLSLMISHKSLTMDLNESMEDEKKEQCNDNNEDKNKNNNKDDIYNNNNNNNNKKNNLCSNSFDNIDVKVKKEIVVNDEQNDDKKMSGGNFQNDGSDKCNNDNPSFNNKKNYFPNYIILNNLNILITDLNELYDYVENGIDKNLLRQKNIPIDYCLKGDESIPLGVLPMEYEPNDKHHHHHHHHHHHNVFVVEPTTCSNELCKRYNNLSKLKNKENEHEKCNSNCMSRKCYTIHHNDKEMVEKNEGSNKDECCNFDMMSTLDYQRFCRVCSGIEYENFERKIDYTKDNNYKVPEVFINESDFFCNCNNMNVLTTNNPNYNFNNTKGSNVYDVDLNNKNFFNDKSYNDNNYYMNKFNDIHKMNEVIAQHCFYNDEYNKTQVDDKKRKLAVHIDKRNNNNNNIIQNDDMNNNYYNAYVTKAKNKFWGLDNNKSLDTNKNATLNNRELRNSKKNKLLTKTNQSETNKANNKTTKSASTIEGKSPRVKKLEKFTNVDQEELREVFGPTGVSGVYFEKSRSSWTAQYKVSGGKRRAKRFLVTKNMSYEEIENVKQQCIAYRKQMEREYIKEFLNEENKKKINNAENDPLNTEVLSTGVKKVKRKRKLKNIYEG
ncbi:transcription factor with AP2 domain(s) [Plasmodium reichenowi]|uniref:Transcription factor with AP2 domain(S) n=1 Tax=Plasmodium reichenowi TaxID=5854 RepID=A0A060S4C8_PLARE|nr:transcription factor with AP2 domain(s) [Plasmodium reichenowi]